VRTFIVAGSPTGQPPADLQPAPDDRVIAADYGAHHALAWGWPIHLLVGDLDSLPGSDARALADAGVPIIIAATAKDETDLELALAHAVAEGAREIVICAALGGRIDHMLANVLLLARPDLTGLDVVIAEGSQTLRVLRGNGADRPLAILALTGAAGDLLSLLPIGGDARGVTTQGLAYPLRDEALCPGQARGVSNLFEGPTAYVALREGLLLVIHTRVDGE